MLGRNLAWTYIFMPNADRWAPVLQYVGHDRLSGPLRSVFAHNWTAVPVRAWLDQMQERLLHGLEPSGSRTRPAQLSRAAFQRAVRELLRNWRHHPLCRRESADRQRPGRARRPRHPDREPANGGRGSGRLAVWL
jgi:hypothetical protein